ncbi:uncharacterized protein LOC134220586 [Armigeres subalbatus]|uniref:uncharacterized protein LOC134220586 n=1 Tax=Armigeres subalbatus TaxID=124917 RepID=UPI002ED5FF23
MSEKRKRRSTRTPPVVDSSSENELVIDLPETFSGGSRPTRSLRPVTPKKSPDKRPAPLTRKKRRRPPSSSSSSDVEDQTLEETIQRVATSNNMSQESIKKILKKLVLNEHILATVKLKEEDEERDDKTHPDTAKADMGGDDEDAGASSSQFKLTRLKAKQLNKPPLPIVPLKAPVPDEEVAALIREDLGSDDDDEEYQPTEDDIPSDDDPNTTISDIDSQPRTPMAPLTPGGTETELDIDECSGLSRDGLFKIPRTRNDSHCSQSEQEQENIARRTRSKLCLQTTAIETIESTFFPPDITTDMYDFDCDMDHVWKEFLSEFHKPMPNHAEDDDDTDPEYVAADQVPVDREELLEVKVSKKELNELVSELLNGLVDESFLNEDEPNNTLIPETMDQNREQSFQELEQKDQYELNTPQPKASNPVRGRSVTPDRTDNDCVFQPNTLSIPTTPIATNPIVLVIPDTPPPPTIVACPDPAVFVPQSYAPAIETDANIAPPMLHSSPVITQIGDMNPAIVTPVLHPNLVFITPIAQSTLPTLAIATSSPGSSILQTQPIVDQPAIVNNSPQISNSDEKKTTTPSGQFFIQVSTPHESSFTKYFVPSFMSSVIPPEERVPVPPSERKYRFTHSLVPITDTYFEGQTGFTNLQMQIFQQQLRQHVQFAAQNFMQTYAHPKFWKMANTFKEMLLDLQEMSNDTAAAKAWNLDRAVECCLSWEKELEKESEENKEFIQFQLEEVRKGEKAKETNKYYQGFFHPKLMEHVVNNPAFMYPKLLPFTPYRNDLRSENRFIRAEERLIAFGLEIFFPIVKQEMNKNKSKSEKNPNVMQVCRHISRYLIPLQNEKQLYSYVTSRRQRCQKMTNPIKYYFKNGKAPVFQHVVESIDFTNVVPPAAYQKGELPHLWDKYIYSKDRLAKLESSGSSAAIVAAHESIQSSSKRPQPQVPEHPTSLNITISLVLDPYQPPIPLNQPASSSVVELPVTAPVVTTTELPDLSSIEQDDKIEQDEKSADNNSFEINIKEESSISIDDDSRDLADFDDQPKDSISVSEINTRSSCSCHHLDNSSEGNSQQQSPEKGQKRLTDYFSSKKGVSSNDLRKTKLKEKLWEIYQRFCDSCISEIDPGKLEKPIRKIYDHFRLIEGFSYFLEKLNKMSSSHGSKKMDVIMAKNDHSVSNEIGNRTHRSSESENRDANYAYNFFEKVEETLLTDNKHAMYENFLDVLQSFNATEDRVPDLYSKIENLLIMDYPELVDLFLTFLLPGQAAEVGRFFEHFILTNANDFLTKLNIYFAKQPAQIRKIYSCLNDLSNEQDVTMEQIKTRILPLLKGNPLLIEWFLQLFSPENPPEGNVSDYEVISVKKLPHPDHTDPDEVFEEVPFVDVAPETNAESSICGTKYIQGRIMYGTQPARLTFLANNCMALASTQKGQSSGIKGCVHNVRSVENRPKATVTDGEMTAGDKEQSQETELPEPVPEDNREEPPRYKLCDETTFNAHAIRLNPLVHGGKGITYADVAHLLVPDPNAPDDSQIQSEDDRSNSPKKQQFKSVPKKRINSPTSKKAATGKSSPTTCKKSPISVSPDSKALATSKKLKTMIEAPALPNQEPSSSCGVKRKAIPIPGMNTSTTVGSSTTDEAILSIKKERCDSSEPQEPTELPSQTSWTRDEDKVILEEIKVGYSTVEQLVERIGMKIKGRHAAEIRRRHEFLMEVLKKFQKSN